MFWETIGLGIHMDVTLTGAIYLNIVAVQVHLYSNLLQQYNCL